MCSTDAHASPRVWQAVLDQKCPSVVMLKPTTRLARSILPHNPRNSGNKCCRHSCNKQSAAPDRISDNHPRKACPAWRMRSGLTSRMSYRRRETHDASLADRLSKTQRLAAVRSIIMRGRNRMSNKRPRVDAGWPILFAFPSHWPRTTQADRSAAQTRHHET